MHHMQRRQQRRSTRSCGHQRHRWRRPRPSGTAGKSSSLRQASWCNAVTALALCAWCYKADRQPLGAPMLTLRQKRLQPSAQAMSSRSSSTPCRTPRLPPLSCRPRNRCHSKTKHQQVCTGWRGDNRTSPTQGGCCRRYQSSRGLCGNTAKWAGWATKPISAHLHLPPSPFRLHVGLGAGMLQILCAGWTRLSRNHSLGPRSCRVPVQWTTSYNTRSPHTSTLYRHDHSFCREAKLCSGEPHLTRHDPCHALSRSPCTLSSMPSRTPWSPRQCSLAGC